VRGSRPLPVAAGPALPTRVLAACPSSSPRLRRRPADVAEAGRRLGADVAEMIRPGLAVYPEPSDDKCPPCPFLDPCQAMRAGHDAEPILRTGYRTRPPVPPEEGRLGGRAWGLGRGAAPPRFRPRSDA